MENKEELLKIILELKEVALKLKLDTISTELKDYDLIIKAYSNEVLIRYLATKKLEIYNLVDDDLELDHVEKI